MSQNQLILQVTLGASSSSYGSITPNPHLNLHMELSVVSNNVPPLPHRFAGHEIYPQLRQPNEPLKRVWNRFVTLRVLWNSHQGRLFPRLNSRTSRVSGRCGRRCRRVGAGSALHHHPDPHPEPPDQLTRGQQGLWIQRTLEGGESGVPRVGRVPQGGRAHGRRHRCTDGWHRLPPGVQFPRTYLNSKDCWPLLFLQADHSN